MLVEVDHSQFKKIFPVDPHPFISEGFIELNSQKVDALVRLVDDDNPVMGLVAGLKGKALFSPFSAPFGGFHYRNEILYIGEIDKYLGLLKEYIIANKLECLELTLPPDIYNQSFNAKLINSIHRLGFVQKVPEITGWIDLDKFKGNYKQKNSREYYRQAIRNGLKFTISENTEDRFAIYNLIFENRLKFGRPIYMTFEDLIKTSALWPVDYFKVETITGEIAASAIFYRFQNNISYAVFWGDNDLGRPLRAMDFIVINLCNHYKNSGYRFIDLGISTESGIPNEGLLRFKESHEAESSLRYKFIFKI